MREYLYAISSCSGGGVVEMWCGGVVEWRSGGMVRLLCGGESEEVEVDRCESGGWVTNE